MDIDGGSGKLDPPQLTYKNQAVKPMRAVDIWVFGQHPMEI
jgi:hypothetical protein